MNTKSNLALGAALFTLGLFACTAGGEVTDGSEGASPPASSSSSSSGPSSPSPSSSSTPSNGPSSGADAGTDAAVDSPSKPARIAYQCQGPSAPTTAVICIETAEGRAGDTVDLEVHLIRPGSCGPAEYATGSFQIDPAKFEIMNADIQPDCLRREQFPSSDPNVDIISWQAFDSTVAPPGCPASAGIGKVDVIKLHIKPGTPPGDYDLPFETSELIGGGPGCSGVFLQVASKLRVLP